MPLSFCPQSMHVFFFGVQKGHVDSSRASLLQNWECPTVSDLVDFLDQLVADWAAADESRSLALAKASVFHVLLPLRSCLAGCPMTVCFAWPTTLRTCACLRIMSHKHVRDIAAYLPLSGVLRLDVCQLPTFRTLSSKTCSTQCVCPLFVNCRVSTSSSSSSPLGLLGMRGRLARLAACLPRKPWKPSTRAMQQPRRHPPLPPMPAPLREWNG